MTNFTRKLNFAIVLIFLIIISLVVLYPLVYVLSAAVSPGSSIATLSIAPFADGFTLDHFRFLFFESNYPIWFRNTLFIAVTTSLGTVIIASLGAYIFSRFRFAFKKGMLLSMLILQIFPSFVGMIAVFIVVLRIGLFDNLWGLILVYLAMNIPFNVWLVKGYMDTIPKSMDEAARIDGASHFRTWLTIIMPIAKPIITFLAITSFVAPWMDFIFPNLLLRSPENQTLALGLFTFVLDDTRNEFTRFAAGSVTVAIPFIIAFVLTQKMLLKTLGGAVKE
ncbi:MAG: sugar ABC transporter permease [Defluviitaleaceae bacterium]|nr:sugar ABC transporter permease [Defluviitaleaceae bacterium]